MWDVYYTSLMNASGDFTFVCPECGESLVVNGSMKVALLDNGCVVCGGALSPDAFTPA
jgi:predicted RNA-binding Zn-ribbon protein involved in translation (DUF1610 family)